MKMLNKLYKKYEEIIKYLIFGVLTTAVSIVSYLIFTRIFNLNYLISNTLSWILAVTFAFITNKIYVFKKIDKNKNVVIKEIISFFAFRIASLIIELILMFILVDVIKLNDMIVKIITQIIIIILNYIFSKVFVFKKL